MPDVQLFNELDRAVAVRITIERDADGTRVFRRTVELAASGDGATETLRNPIDTDGPHTVHVLVKNGPEATTEFTGWDSSPLGSGPKGLWITVAPEGIEFQRAVS